MITNTTGMREFMAGAMGLLALFFWIGVLGASILGLTSLLWGFVLMALFLTLGCVLTLVSGKQ